MKKNDIIKTISEKAAVSKKDAEAVMNAFAELITTTLTEDREEKITLGNIGTFKVKTVPQKEGIIQLGERKGSKYCVPEHDEICFKMSKTTKKLA